MSVLFTSLKVRGVELRNRVAVAPMCQYSAVDGFANQWHLVHLGSRAVGGAGLVIVEASAVSPDGRITADDLGLWCDGHIDAFRPITRFIEEQGCVPGIQLAHSGRRGARSRPWTGNAPLEDDQSWPLLAPSALTFDDGYQTPCEMTSDDMGKVLSDFVAAAHRSLAAGFKLIELHMAHGYLLHSFLSPLTNLRKDEFGGDLQGRASFPLRLTKAVREVWPSNLPLFVRLSVVDWVQGGFDVEQAIQLAKWMKNIGVDLIDCSSGSLVPREDIPSGHPFQVPFAAEIRKVAGIATGAVGFILDPIQAEAVLAEGNADIVLLGRAMLRDPYWPHHAADVLGSNPIWPIQYARAVRKNIIEPIRK